MSAEMKISSTFLQKDIDELPGLSRSHIYSLQIKNISRVYHLFSDGYTCKSLDEKIGKPISQDINKSFEEAGFKGRLAKIYPAGALYAFYKKEKRNELRDIHEKAVEILADVHWGSISAEKMAEELTYIRHGIKICQDDVDTIIKKGLKILEVI
jgi:hypothetical protein